MSLLSLRGRLLSLIAKELELCIPQFEPYTSDYQIVIYACRDLEAWMKTKWDIDDHGVIYEKIEEYFKDEHRDFKIFLGFWVNRWLEKWRERVKFLSTKPKVPPQYLDRVKNARRLYQEMEHRRELKEIVVRKLVCQGEICMSELIAENLIIEEIAKRTQTMDPISKLVRLNPLEILNSLSCTISRLPKEKGPLIYLNIKPYML